MTKLKQIGAVYKGDGVCEFSVWAPRASRLSVSVKTPQPFEFELQKDDEGYWTGTGYEIYPETLYYFNIDDKKERPDPASLYQPNGVHKASEVADLSNFTWEDQNWQGIALEEMVIYELHTGTFTHKGTFEGIRENLGYFCSLGINAIEIMPVAQFPGGRNWGYDGVYPFAVQDSYGGYRELQRLVNECHKHGIAVILDVVYNHLGPEGNYLRDFGPYFTDKYSTPWGEAINFDEAHSDEVRNFFIQNALMWLRDFHIDGLRLDAVHAIMDMSANPFLEELSAYTEQLSKETGRVLELIGESDLNNYRLTLPREKAGTGLDGQWADDFHHALHAYMTGERGGYYQDFGSLQDLADAYDRAFAYNGKYSVFRQRTFGSDPSGLPYSNFVVCSQNHDQVGNRMTGDRLSGQLSFEALKTIAGLVITSPYVPMLFMGEEYGEDKPFLYFVSHTDEGLIEAVRKGRAEEFKTFRWKGEPPDPADPKTFHRSVLEWKYDDDLYGKMLWELYRFLIELRKNHYAFCYPAKEGIQVQADEDHSLLKVTRNYIENKPGGADDQIYCIFNLGKRTQEIHFPQKEGYWHQLLGTASTTWLGPGDSSPDLVQQDDIIPIAPESLLIYKKEKN